LMASGKASRSNVLLAILAGANGSDADLVAHKVKIASQFTRTVDAAGMRAVYDGQLANLVVRTLIRSAPSMQDDTAIQAGIEQAMSRLSALHFGSFVEAPAGTHNIVLLASSDQLAANGGRISALADALTSDLNQLRAGGPTWTVSVQAAAGTVRAVREQLRAFDSAILIGRIPMPIRNGAPRLDLYRLPDCPLLDVDGNGTVSAFSADGIDPRCRLGSIISVLRGPSLLSESNDIARKLDQLTTYHKASSLKNASWLQRINYIEAGWFGDLAHHQAGIAETWATIPAALRPILDYRDEGKAIQRRDAFVNCITQNNEICGASLHGSPQALQFEGPGVPGTFYSDDSIDWSPASLSAGSVKAKYITLDSCSTQNFLEEQSVGTRLLMSGDTLLTRGTTEITWISNHNEEAVILYEYAMLLNGSTYAEALYGRMAGSSDAIQGDPYITMKPVPPGPKPKLVIDGIHHNRGAVSLNIAFPDSVNGSKLIKVITYSNRGDADLHLRVGMLPYRLGVDTGSGNGYQGLITNGSIVYIEYVQTHSDGRVLAWPAFEMSGDAMVAILKPGQSVGVTYRLNVPVGTDGKPSQRGQFVWQVRNTSNDPASSSVFMEMSARVR
jgi:hypothetical protein